jgi:hypothetical protein
MKTGLSRKRAFVLLAGLAFTAGALSAGAVPVFYPDQIGDTVSYTSISEETLTAGDPDELFGTPTISGNTLNFDPISFSSFSSSSQLGDPDDATSGQLNFDVEAFAGKTIETIELVESGEINLIDFFGTGSADTFATVEGDVILTIFEVDGSALGLPLVINSVMTFGPSAGDWDLDTDGVVAADWTGGKVLDIQQALVDNLIAFNDGATKVSLQIVNTLTAGSEPGTSSFITKKDFHSFSITAMGRPVPDTASTGLLLILACTSLLGARNKLSGKEE